MDPILGTALIKGGTALAKYLYGRYNQPSFGETSYAKRLKERMRTGMYGPGERREIVSDVAKKAGNIASTTKAGYRGRLASQGMLGSVAGIGKQAEIDQQAITPVTDTSRKLNIANVASKERAKDEYAMAETNWGEQVRKQQGANRQELVGGVVDAAAGYGLGKIRQSAFKDLDVSTPGAVSQKIIDSADPQAAAQILSAAGIAESRLRSGSGEMTSKEITGLMISNPGKVEEIFAALAALDLLPKEFYKSGTE